MSYKFTVLLLFCLISVKLDAGIYYTQTEKAIHVYTNPQLPAVVNIPLSGSEFVQIQHIDYEIDEKLGSYKVHQSSIASSKNFKVTDLDSSQNTIQNFL